MKVNGLFGQFYYKKMVNYKTLIWLMFKPFYILFFLFLFFNFSFADGGIGYKGIKVNLNGTNSWYNIHGMNWGYQGCGDFGSTFYNSGNENWNNTNLGTFDQNAILQITGFAVVGWANGGDYIAGKLDYKIWRQGDTEPATWNIINIGNYQTPTNGPNQVVCSNNDDRIVGFNNGTINFQPGAPGVYNFKVKGFGRVQFTGGGGGSFNANDGPELTSTFTIRPQVTFDANGGIGNMPNQNVVYNTSTILNNNLLTRSCYTFNGWNTIPDGTGISYANNANITLTDNLTLYAQWIYTPIIITQHPQTSDQTVCLNATPNQLTVNAIGSGLTYQWFSNTIMSQLGSTEIVGATSPTFTPPSNVLGRLFYYARIKDANCEVFSFYSGAIRIVQITSQNIESHPATSCSSTVRLFGQVLVPGLTTLNSNQAGENMEAQLGYVLNNHAHANDPSQSGWNWNVNLAEYAGADVSNFDRFVDNINDLIPGSTYNFAYRFRVSGCAYFYTTTITISIDNPAMSITAQPSQTSQTINDGEMMPTLSISATGSGLSYQWYLQTIQQNSGGVLIPGATNASYTPPNNYRGTYYYYVIVSQGSACLPIVSNISGPITVERPLNKVGIGTTIPGNLSVSIFETNTGLDRPISNNLSIKVNHLNRLTINGSGHVGINNPYPTSRLDINANNGFLRIRNLPTENRNDGKFLIISEEGNIGYREVNITSGYCIRVGINADNIPRPTTGNNEWPVRFNNHDNATKMGQSSTGVENFIHNIVRNPTSIPQFTTKTLTIAGTPQTADVINLPEGVYKITFRYSGRFETHNPVNELNLKLLVNNQEYAIGRGFITGHGNAHEKFGNFSETLVLTESNSEIHFNFFRNAPMNEMSNNRFLPTAHEASGSFKRYNNVILIEKIQ